MSSETTQFLQTFAVNIHWGAFGHPEDLDCFLDFVLAAYRHGDRSIPFETFSTVIDTYAKNTGPASDKQFITKKIAYTMLMFEKYSDGIKLLTKFTK